MKSKSSFFAEPTVSHLLLGVGVGTVVSFAAMLLCAFILTLRDFDAATATPMSNVCLALGTAVGGFVCTVAHRSKGLIMGAATGFALFAVITLAALIINGGNMTANTPLRLVIMTVLGAAGGVVGVNRSSKRRLG